jgi:hypothetical protein
MGRALQCFRQFHSRLEVIGSFRFDFEYDYEYEI